MKEWTDKDSKLRDDRILLGRKVAMERIAHKKFSEISKQIGKSPARTRNIFEWYKQSYPLHFAALIMSSRPK